MGSFGVDHGHFQVAIKWCSFDVQPIHAEKIQHPSGSGFDKDQAPAFVAPNYFSRPTRNKPDIICSGIMLLVVGFALATPSTKPFEQGEIGPDLFRAACSMGLEGEHGGRPVPCNGCPVTRCSLQSRRRRQPRLLARSNVDHSWHSNCSGLLEPIRPTSGRTKPEQTYAANVPFRNITEPSQHRHETAGAHR
jgi:hypothetical protein